MSALTDLIDKLKAGKEKMDAVGVRASNVADAKNRVATERANLEALKDKAPGMADARAAIRKALAAKKTAVQTPTIDVSPESIVRNLT